MTENTVDMNLGLLAALVQHLHDYTPLDLLNLSGVFIFLESGLKGLDT